MEKVIVGIADAKVVRSPDVLATYALGSCIGICLYDNELKLAGMAHILLPSREDAVNQKNAYKFADSGIKALILDMRMQGGRKGCLTAKIAGGAEMFRNIDTTGPSIGQRNISMVKEVLKEEGIPVVADDTGKNYGRTIFFYAESGALEIKSVKKVNVF